MELSTHWVLGGCRELVSWVVLVGVKGGPSHPVNSTSASHLATYEAGTQFLLNRIPGGQSEFIYAKPNSLLL